MITVAEFVRDGWQANIDNGICDVYVYYGDHKPYTSPYDRIVYKAPLPDSTAHVFHFPARPADIILEAVREVYIVYRTPKPDTLPETLPPLFETQSTKR